MTKTDKLKIIKSYDKLFNTELSKIPYSELKIIEKGRAEDVAEEYYRQQGYEVYRSRVKKGYRSIGAEYYWKSFIPKLSKEDKHLIEKLKTILPEKLLKRFAYMVKNKKGTPDLLLIKNDKIEFVEVKYNNETVKRSTVEFYIKYGDEWPISLLRVIRK